MPTRPFGKDSVNARKPTLEQYIGDRIRRRRTQLGLTQEQLARTIGVSYQQIQKYETGACRSTTALTRAASAALTPLSSTSLK